MVATRFKKTQGGCNTPERGAGGRARARHGQKSRCAAMPGEWQEPQRWVFSTRNRLQLKESRKDDAAVKWPRCEVPGVRVAGPCLLAPPSMRQKKCFPRSSCNFFSQLPAAPRHCKAHSKLWAREPHILFRL